MRAIIISFTFFMPVFAFAAGAEGHHDVIPWKAIGAQALNLGVLLAFLGYKLRHTVRDHFKTRQQTYKELIGKAEAAKETAESNKKAISERLARLESQADSSLKQAKADAEELKQKILKEAEQISLELEREAQRSVDFEIMRAKAQLRKELLAEALDLARENMKKTVGAKEQQRLQSEFVEKIQVVQS